MIKTKNKFRRYQLKKNHQQLINNQKDDFDNKHKIQNKTESNDFATKQIKYNLKKWTFAELRDLINTSTSNFI